MAQKEAKRTMRFWFWPVLMSFKHLVGLWSSGPVYNSRLSFFIIANLLFWEIFMSSLSVCILLWQRPAPADLWTRAPGGQQPVAVRTERPPFRTTAPFGLPQSQDDPETDSRHAEDDEAAQEARGCCGCCIFSVSNTDICCSAKHCMSGWHISGSAELNWSVINSRSNIWLILI